MAWPLLLVVAIAFAWERRREPGGRGLGWFLCWLLAGLLWAFSLLTGFSVGLLLLPLAAVVLLWAARSAPHAREATGFILGVAAIAVVGILTVTSSAAADAASDRGLPRRVGPIYVVPTGNGTEVRVWRTAAGYCVLAFRPELIDRAFCVPKATLERSGPMFSCLCMQRHETTLVVGTVKRSVRRGEKTDRTGTSAVPLFPVPAALGTNLRLFRAVVRSGSPPKWRVQFYDRGGRVVGTVSQGYNP